MVLIDLLKRLQPDEVIYLAVKQTTATGSVQRHCGAGSGYIYIGHAKDINLDLLGNREVHDAYHREVDYPGTVIIIEGAECGRYWFWHECDPRVPLNEKPYTTHVHPYEDLYFAIFRQTLIDYRSIINEKMKKVKPTHIDEVNDIIYVSHKQADKAGLFEFMAGSASGQNLIRDLEDEIRITFQHPEIQKIKKPQDRVAAFRRERSKILLDRAKKNEKAKYATIKGRSVNHDLD